MQLTHATTLFERLGGTPAVELAVELFAQRVVSDPRLATSYRGVELARLKLHQTEFLTEVLGGPRSGGYAAGASRYLSMPADARQFDIVTGHLIHCLDDLGVGAEMIAEIFCEVALRKFDSTPTGERLPLN